MFVRLVFRSLVVIVHGTFMKGTMFRSECGSPPFKYYFVGNWGAQVLLFLSYNFPKL